jgi:electron transfer flavoprotein alpha subunit
MATVRPHSYKVSNYSPTDFHDEILVLPEQLKEENYSNFKLINRKPIETVFPKIENEKILVSVGRGIGSKENVEVVYDFAKTIGAGIACSRPVVDNGWLPHELQVGLSGKVVAPKIYIALGISGSIQHIVGMQSSEYIIAVNKDEFAPIFKVSHLGIVGDIKKVLPRLTKLVNKP